MKRATVCTMWVLLATSCGAKDKAELAPEAAPQGREVASQAQPPAADPKPQSPSAELPFRLAARPKTMFVPQSCLSAPGATAAEAQANCKIRKRSGSRYERRQCNCDTEHILEVRKDAPPAFYFGCCASVGDSPQQARNTCDKRVREGWCEPEDPEVVHVAVGPFTRTGPFRELDGPDFSYLIPSKLADTGWTADNGDPPCFPDGTPVELAGGPRPIEEVRPGDEVVTLRDGQRVTVPVIGIKVREADALRVFTFDEGALRLTPNHLVWLDDDWRPASEVEVGDVLEGLEGPKTVRRIEEQSDRVTVRTLRVGTPNSFFAGGVWVHNY